MLELQEKSIGHKNACSYLGAVERKDANMARLKAIQCKQCEGIMTSKNIAKHNQNATWLFLLIGTIVTFMVVGAIIGVPLILVGLYLGCGSKSFWVCRSCGTKVEKM